MLDFLRKRKRSWIITILLGLIIIVFIAFYGGSKYRDTGGQDVAQVNGEIISQREFALEYERAVDRYRELLKGSFSPEMLKSLNIKRTLLDELIQKHLLLQEARAMGLTVTDDELAGFLSLTPEFQVAGRFNKERYIQLLRANKLTPADFEEQQRQQLTIQRLYGLIIDSVQVPEVEVRDRYRLEQEKINLNYVRLPLSQFLSDVKVSEEEIKQFYDQNKEALKEPLRVQVEYLSYPFEQFASSVQINDKEIEDYYQTNRDSKFHKPKQAKLRYILVRVAPDADAKQKEAARVRANRLLADARAGKDFAQLAKKESDDPTASKGGDLGWIAQGQLPPALDKTVFNLSKGGISDLIETPGGFQIVKVDDVKNETTLTLKEASEEIARSLKTEKAKGEAAKIADRDRVKALGGGDFAQLAQDSRAAVHVTGLFTTGEAVPEIGQNPEFYKAAFALKANEVSPVIEGEKSYYLLRLKQRKEPSVPPLDVVKADIEKRLKESKAHRLLLDKANALLEQLKKEKDIGKLAEQNGLKLEETGWFARNTPQLPKIGELTELRGAGVAVTAQKPIAERVFTQKDSAYLFELKDSQGADMERFEREKNSLTQQALAEARQRVAQKFMEGLKSKAKVQIHAETLEEG
ncbi:MAG TPA: SurA N-terminal domain-containing protein [Candidatus Binatia bacterium]